MCCLRFHLYVACVCVCILEIGFPNWQHIHTHTHPYTRTLKCNVIAWMVAKRSMLYVIVSFMFIIPRLFSFVPFGPSPITDGCVYLFIVFDGDFFYLYKCCYSTKNGSNARRHLVLSQNTIEQKIIR